MSASQSEYPNTPANNTPIASVSTDERVESTKSGSESLSAWKGLLWCEWFSQSKLILAFIALWLVTAWVLPIYVHSGWILLLGILFAMVAGPAYGGGDIIEGTEEFTFALPVSRKRRYKARLLVGGGALLLLTLMDLLVLGLDLPQAMAGVFVTTGLLEARPFVQPKLLYGLILALPFSQFSISFAIAANAHSRAMVMASGFWGILISLALLQGGLAYEEWFWEELTGYIAYPVLMGAGGIALILGYFMYKEKELSPSLTPLSLPPKTWVWTGLFTLTLAGLGFLLPSFFKLWKSLLE